ncbi:hypothetical protein LCGC14_1120610 [marine sediment metagenome]|uniref:Uncharacterized protein n=1 Tax=marine sediment metagenome TaxID=412755 RepID=A0A0F9M8X0_9ZZZZ
MSEVTSKFNFLFQGFTPFIKKKIRDLFQF